jgi:hypothetical protein
MSRRVVMSVAEEQVVPGTDVEVWAHMGYATLRLLSVSAGVSPLMRLMTVMTLEGAPQVLADRTAMVSDVAQLATGVDLPPIPTADQCIAEIAQSGNPAEVRDLLRMLADMHRRSQEGHGG